jgi:hypothetical protein
MELYYKNMNIEALEGEIWVPVKDYESLYEVSNLGRVKSVGRTHKVGNKSGIRVREPKIMSQTLNVYGYLIVSLHKEGKLKSSKVARLVCSAFHPNQDNKRTVNHISGNKCDNRVENLEWASDTEQQIHRRDVLKMRGNWYNKKRGTFSDEWKKNISLGKKGSKIDKGRWVLNLENGIYYRNIASAADCIGIKATTLRAMLCSRNRNKTTFIYA